MALLDTDPVSAVSVEPAWTGDHNIAAQCHSDQSASNQTPPHHPPPADNIVL